ncbi:hypothetical protein CKO11_05420 [Rhodobacter sp. TJ_12]|uniref:pentapeptide repeat-containing protein n=1 Tax=Rhodobacter sp. TJ_12 TaxID=2029399 RepID=UPI001CBD4CDA|nr:pentapeptide repeat-containing protein [Rhodobacter sp. TJ_12]MBZ4021898.1 hypothetical protein [Rhodobacter sp. TJ_12]
MHNRPISKTLSRRQAAARARRKPPASPGPAPLSPAPAARTASGAAILGLWGWAERIVLMGTLVSIGLGLWAFGEERSTRQAEALSRAWEVVTTPVPGNSGKRSALEYLAAQGLTLRGIDLSCARMGGNWHETELYCQNPVDLEGLAPRAPKGAQVDLRMAHLEGAALSGADFAGANLSYAHLVAASLDGANLRGTTLFGAQLDKASLYEVDLRGATLGLSQIRGANLQGADLRGATLMAADLSGAHVSGADFRDADLTQLVAEGIWAWEDAPPKGLTSSGVSVKFCTRDDIFSEAQRLLLGDPCQPVN